MTEFHKKWADEKTRFENTTGLKKPRESEKGIAAAFGRHTGLSESLKGCDQASIAFDAAMTAYRIAMTRQYAQLTKAADTYIRSAESFDRAASSYQRVLTGAFADPKRKADYRNELSMLFGTLFNLVSDVQREKQRLAEQLIEHKPL